MAAKPKAEKDKLRNNETNDEELDYGLSAKKYMRYQKAMSERLSTSDNRMVQSSHFSCVLLR